MKLFTIGDSISQGFMSLAAARTELSFSTLIARSLGLTPGTSSYPIPVWGAGGLPINIESALRKLQRKYGPDVKGPIEWLGAISTINGLLDEVEDHYERGAGNISLPQAGETRFYANVAVAGFTVADAWKVTPAACLKAIASDKDNGDGFFTPPNCRFERTAHAVLNPSRDPAFNDYSQLDWLRHHHEGEGVQNLILWLGSNNALGTIVRMDVKSTAAAPVPPLDMTYVERDAFNLWTVAHFTDEFEELMKRVDAILAKRDRGPKTNVFIGTVPPVTIAPLARGVGTSEVIAPDPFGVLPGGATYFERYTYFLFDIDYARRTANSLTLAEALEIDRTIAGYNGAIKAIVARYNARPGAAANYVIVDVANQLLRLAFKRNAGKPTYPIPPDLQAYIAQRQRPVNTVYYGVDRKGVMSAGGVFSLDGVHPTAIGHGLIAQEFLNAMAAAGVAGAAAARLDWDAIVASDSLWTDPMAIIPELYDNTRLAELLLDLLRLP